VEQWASALAMRLVALEHRIHELEQQKQAEGSGKCLSYSSGPLKELPETITHMRGGTRVNIITKTKADKRKWSCILHGFFVRFAQLMRIL